MNNTAKIRSHNQWSTRLVGLGMIGIALLLMGGLGYVILTHNSLLGGDFPDDTLPKFLWRFARTLGFIRPLLVILAGFWLLQVGRGILSQHISSARWAKSVLAWLFVIVIGGIILTIYNGLAEETTTDSPSGASFISNVLPWFLSLIYLVTLYVTLNRNMAQFHGDENIKSQRARNAWNLLMPILLIFMFIGVRPLERVFITSLTNENFAIGIDEKVDYIGLDNFVNLLSVRLDEIPCETDDTGACLTEIDNNGNAMIVYPRARRYLNDNVPNYRTSRETDPNLESYVPFTEFDLFGKHWALSVRDPDFIDSVINSVIYSVVAIFLQLVIGLFMAMVLTAKLRGMGMMRVAMLVPLAIPTLIATQFWEVMLQPDASGLVNNALLSVGLIHEPKGWLLESSLQIPALILVIVWKETPSMALLLLPSLLSISPEIYQAASVDGANRFQRFFRITLPMLRPAIGVALILRTMVMLRVFDVFEVLLGRRQFSMASYAYDRLTQEQLLGYSSAVSVVIFMIILVFTIFYMRTLKIDEI